MCRQGASVIQTQVLEQVADASLRVYVACVPILPDDGGAGAEESATLISDERGIHFWDANKVLPPAFADVLGLPKDCPAWDVYLAYRPGPTWENEPPAPAFWHHQLGELELAPKLDGEAFARQLRELL